MRSPSRTDISAATTLAAGSDFARHDKGRYSKSLSSRRRGTKDSANNSMPPIYGEGDVLTLMSVLVSVFVEVAGEGFTIVVLLSFFSAGGFVTVVSFCSQAARSAAPVKRQMYLFM